MLYSAHSFIQISIETIQRDADGPGFNLWYRPLEVLQQTMVGMEAEPKGRLQLPSDCRSWRGALYDDEVSRPPVFSLPAGAVQGPHCTSLTLSSPAGIVPDVGTWLKVHPKEGRQGQVSGVLVTSRPLLGFTLGLPAGLSQRPPWPESCLLQ